MAERTEAHQAGLRPSDRWLWRAVCGHSFLRPDPGSPRRHREPKSSVRSGKVVVSYLPDRSASGELIGRPASLSAMLIFLMVGALPQRSATASPMAARRISKGKAGIRPTVGVGTRSRPEALLVCGELAIARISPNSTLQAVGVIVGILRLRTGGRRARPSGRD